MEKAKYSDLLMGGLLLVCLLFCLGLSDVLGLVELA